MNAFQKVKEELNKFQAKREEHQSVKLNQELEKSKKEYANAKIKEQTIKNREYSQGIRAKAREQRFAGFKGFAQKVTARTKARSGKRAVNLGGSPGSAGSIFTASSNSPNNIYFKGSSGNNPYNFTGSKPTKAKRKGKRITINL
jgi:hypothetical protein